jgi:bifunctional non-homologous end joining protein LigD
MTRPDAGRSVRPPSVEWPFFVLEHWTRHEHFDLHLEVDGRLLGWVLPTAPSVDPTVRRFALRGPDHEREFGRFEGTLLPGAPGAGVVMVWDLGTYVPFPPAGMPLDRWLDRGRLKLHLFGEKMRGLWDLVRWRSQPGGRETWVLVKLHDRHADGADALERAAWSALTGRTREAIAAAAPGTAQGD